MEYEADHAAIAQGNDAVTAMERAADDLEKLWHQDLSFREQVDAILRFIQTFYQRALTLEQICALDTCTDIKSLSVLLINRWPTAAVYLGMRLEVYKAKMAAGQPRPTAKPINLLYADDPPIPRACQ